MEDTVLGSHAETSEPLVDEEGDLVLPLPPGLLVRTGEHKREMENLEEPSGKRSRVEMLEAYHMNLTTQDPLPQGVAGHSSTEAREGHGVKVCPRQEAS